jgi:hypothetical protein
MGWNERSPGGQAEASKGLDGPAVERTDPPHNATEGQDQVHHLPARAKPVSLARKTCPHRGTQEENWEWLPYLADGVGKRCVGRDPMSIPLDVLTASGHPPSKTAKLVAAFAKGAGGDCLCLEGIRRYSDIRGHCLRCVENDAEVRRCSTVNCPFWPYRMGRNSHNPRRGSDPFGWHS